MSSIPVALILGAGANIGQNVAKTFAAKGYKIALASRSLKEEDSTESQLLVKGDFSDPESVIRIFSKVQSSIGTPHVVVYNGQFYFALSYRGSTRMNDADNLVKLPLRRLRRPVTHWQCLWQTLLVIWPSTQRARSSRLSRPRLPSPNCLILPHAPSSTPAT